MIASMNNLNFFRILLRQYKKNDINRCTPIGWSLLHFLTNNNKQFPLQIREYAVELLLQQDDIDVNLQNHRGETPLLQLLYNWKAHNSRIAQLLLDKGGLTPITAATTLELEQIIDLMQKTIDKKDGPKKDTAKVL